MKSRIKMFWFMTLHIKLWFGAKTLHIRFDKVDGIIRIYDAARYLVLFGPEKYNAIYSRTRYLICLTYVVSHMFFSHIYAKIKLDFYDFLPIEKTLSFHNVIIHNTY